MNQAQLLAAYQASCYRVLLRRPIDLHVGQTCPDLDALLKAEQHSCAAFISACNPHGVVVGASDNVARCQALEQRLTAQGLHWLPALGGADQAGWDGEPSVLVTDLSITQAQTLAEEFEQLAWLQHQAGEASRLCFTRHWPGSEPASIPRAPVPHSLG